MKDILIILLGLIAIVLVVMMFTEKGRFMLKSFYNSLFIDVAKTPKGAEAIYNEAIDEAQKQYSKAKDNLSKIAGILNTSKTHKDKTEMLIKDTKLKMEHFAKSNQFDKVDLYASELSSLEEELELYSEQVIKYTQMLDEAKLLANNFEEKLTKLKRDKQVTVRQLELNLQTKEMYDDLDELKASKTSDKMLHAVKYGLSETTEHAVGARIVHNSKHSTQIAKADAEMKFSKSNAYAEELKRKYGGK